MPKRETQFVVVRSTWAVYLLRGSRAPYLDAAVSRDGFRWDLALNEERRKAASWYYSNPFFGLDLAVGEYVVLEVKDE